MKKFWMKWKEMTPAEKVFTGILLVSSVLTIALALLQLLGVWRDAALVYLPLLCVNMLCLAAFNWKASRTVAVINLVAAGFMLVSIIISFYSRFAAA